MGASISSCSLGPTGISGFIKKGVFSQVIDLNLYLKILGQEYIKSKASRRNKYINYINIICETGIIPQETMVRAPDITYLPYLALFM